METRLHNPYIINHVCYTEGAFTRHLDKVVKKKTREGIGKKISKYIPFAESEPAKWKRMSRDPRYTTDIAKACVQYTNVVYASQYFNRGIISCNVIDQHKDKDGNLVLDVTYYFRDDSGSILRHTEERTGDGLRNMLFDTRRDPGAKPPPGSR